MLDILLEAAVRATFIAVAALGALWLLRVRAAAVRHRVATVVMLVMLALPFAIAWTPDVSLRVLPPTHSNVPSAVTQSPYSTSLAVISMDPATVELTPAPSWDRQAWLLAAYLTGVAVLLARLAIGTVRVSLLAREATVVNGQLTSARITTPFTFGLLKPRILLPEGWHRWSATRLAVVLDHEHAHAARRDPLVNWLALLNRAVFWFHPLAWWLERHLAALAEEACDAAVLARGYSASDYSQCLLDLARMSGRRPMHRLIGTPMPGSALPARIAKILDGGIGMPGSRAAVASATGLATLAAVVLATITLAQEPASPRETAPPQATTSPRTLVDVYELALANDPIVREAEANYRAVAEARPQARSAVAQATADRDAARQALVIRVAEPYFDVLAAESALAFRVAARETLSRQLEQTQRRFEVGLISVTDVQETHAHFDQAVVDALTAQRALDEAERTLGETVGEPVGELRPLAEDLPLDPPNPSDEEQWIDTALQRNPALIATRMRAESADGDAAAQRSALSDLERVAVQTEQATRAAYLGVVSEISRARALEQSVRSNEAALKATRAAFDVGTRNTVDVMAAQSNLRRSETAYAVSRYDYALNMLRLQRAAGGLTGQELEEVERWFE
jgi:outer membrane protein